MSLGAFGVRHPLTEQKSVLLPRLSHELPARVVRLEHHAKRAFLAAGVERLPLEEFSTSGALLRFLPSLDPALDPSSRLDREPRPAM